MQNTPTNLKLIMASTSTTTNHHHFNVKQQRQNGWRLQPKRGISLDSETLVRSMEYEEFLPNEDEDLMVGDGRQPPPPPPPLQQQIIAANKNTNLIDGFTAQYYRASSAISERQQQQQQQHPWNQQPQMVHHSHNNHQLIKANSIGDATTPNNNDNITGVGTATTTTTINNFSFSNDEINHFRRQDGCPGMNDQTTCGTMDRSTRATTPADEQIFQEPVESLQVRIGRLLSCEEMADMHFLVGSAGQPPTSNQQQQQQQKSPSIAPSPTSPVRKLRIPAHRLVLATASPIFKQILVDPVSGQLIECEGDLAITDIEPASFLEFLRYVYTDSAKLNKDNVVGVLVCARRYRTLSLEHQSMDYIHRCLMKRSSLAIWLAARNYGDTELEMMARKSMQHYAESMLLSNDFIRVDQASLYEILSDDLLRADEVVIFRALTRWAKQNCLKNGICPNRANVRMMIGDAINLIRFPLMTEEQLQRIVAAEGILEDELLRALVHCSRNWPRSSHMISSPEAPLTFSNEPRAYQKLNGRLHNVYRFASFENSLANHYLNRSLNFLANKRVWLAGVGLYAPRKACTFYLNVWVRVRRADHDRQAWSSPLDQIEQSILLKYDGQGHIIHVNFDEPLQIEANVQYEVQATINPSTRSTSLVRARLHPHLYYTRPNEVNFYYGTEGQYATKVRINNRGENVIFNFNWERDTIQEESISDTTSQQAFGYVTNTAVSEPSTPNPPPRPPPPQEYRRPTRMQRLRRALSFVDNRPNEKELAKMSARESGLLEGQIPLLMFYA